MNLVGWAIDPTLVCRAGLTRRLFLFTAAILFTSACEAPVDKRTRPATSATTSKTIHSTSTSMPAQDHPNTVAALKLTVNTESMKPQDFWHPVYDEAVKQSKELSRSAYQSWVEQNAAKLISDAVAEMLMYQRASLRFSEEMQKNVDRFVDAEIRKTVTLNHQGIQRVYEKHLAERGQSIDDVRKKIRREIIISNFLDTEIKPKIAEPTRAELVNAFQANRERWQKPSRRSMSLIEVRFSDRLPKETVSPTPQQLETARSEAKQRASDAHRRLLEGDSFSDVVRHYSDGGRVEDGGAWGWIAPDSVREKYTPAVQELSRLKAGQISEVIAGSDCFFIVRCDELDPGSQPDFVHVQTELRDEQFRLAYARAINELVEELRKSARVEPNKQEDLLRLHAAVVAAAPRF